MRGREHTRPVEVVRRALTGMVDFMLGCAAFFFCNGWRERGFGAGADLRLCGAAFAGGRSIFLDVFTRELLLRTASTISELDRSSHLRHRLGSRIPAGGQ